MTCAKPPGPPIWVCIFFFMFVSGPNKLPFSVSNVKRSRDLDLWPWPSFQGQRSRSKVQKTGIFLEMVPYLCTSGAPWWPSHVTSCDLDLQKTRVTWPQSCDIVKKTFNWNINETCCDFHCSKSVKKNWIIYLFISFLKQKSYFSIHINGFAFKGILPTANLASLKSQSKIYCQHDQIFMQVRQICFISRRGVGLNKVSL